MAENKIIYKKTHAPINWHERNEYYEEQAGKIKQVCKKCNMIFWAKKPRTVCSIDCMNK